MHDAIGVRKADDYTRLAKGHALGVADLVGFPVGHAQDEMLEGLTPEPLADGVHVHIGSYTPVKIDLPIQRKSSAGTPQTALPKRENPRAQ